MLEGKCVPELDETDGLQLVEGLVTTVERTELQAVAQPLTAVRRDRPISLIQLEPRSPAPPANDALVEEAEGVLETEFPGRLDASICDRCQPVQVPPVRDEMGSEGGDPDETSPSGLSRGREERETVEEDGDDAFLVEELEGCGVAMN